MENLVSQTNSNSGQVMMTIDASFSKGVNSQIEVGANFDGFQKDTQAYNTELWDMPMQREHICGTISARRAHDWFLVQITKR